MPIKPASQDRYETHVIEAWVNEFRIGWITVTFFDVGDGPEMNDLSVSSSVIKTRKLYCNYNGNPVAYNRMGKAAKVGDYSEPQKWIEEQWTNMLEKAGII